MEKMNRFIKWFIEVTKQHKRFNKIIALFAIGVLLFTSYAMILPGIALEQAPICNLEEHVHTDSCYELASDGSVGTTLICGLEEHTHTESCYPEPTLTSEVFSLMALSAEVPAEIDFGQYLTSIALAEKNSQWDTVWNPISIVNGEAQVTNGDYVQFTMKYTIPPNTLSTTNNVISYYVPSGLKIIKAQSGTVYNSGGQEIGTYLIATDGKITITFSGTAYQSGNEVKGAITFEGSLDKTQLNSENKTTVYFNATNTITFDVGSEPVPNSLTISKSGNYDSTTNEINYTIKVQSATGTSQSVLIEDALTQMTYSWQYRDNFVVKDKSGNIVGNVSITKSSANNTFQMTVPQMAAGAEYTITYNVKTDDVYNGNESVVNTAKATSKALDGSPITTPTTGTTVGAYRELLSKTGQLSGNLIHWKIIVNSAYSDIGGWKLSDILTENNIDITSTTATMNTIMTTYQKNGTTSVSTQPFNLKVGYTFPLNTTAKYVIEYDTPISLTAISKNYSNTATLIRDDGKPSINSGAAQVYVDFNPLLKEAVSKTLSADQKSLLLDWRTTITAPQGGSFPLTIYEDTLSDGQFFTFNQIQLLKTANVLPSGSTIEVKVDGNWISSTLMSTSQQGTAFKITFPSGYALAAGTALRIAYQSTADVTNVRSTFYYGNIAALNNYAFQKQAGFTYAPMLSKIDRKDGSGKAETTYTWYDGEEKPLEWQIAINLPPEHLGKNITLIEALPSGIDLTNFEIQFADSGTSRFVDNGNGTYTATGTYYSKPYQIVASKDATGALNIPIPSNLNDGGKITLNLAATVNATTSWATDATNPKIKTATFSNTVRMKIQDVQVGSVTQAQTINKDQTVRILTKDVTYTLNPTILNYSIKINPDRTDLLAGTDTLNLKDTMSHQYDENYSFALVPGSVKVFEILADGTKVALENEAFTAIYKDLPVVYGKVSHELSLTIPDATYVVVEYQYLAKGPAVINPGQNWKYVENSVELTGVAGTKTSVGSSVEVTKSSAVADTDGIQVYKVDEKNYNIVLPGAEFSLRKYDANTQTYIPVLDDAGNQRIFVAESNGAVSLNGLAFNTAYQLVETKAPDGYLLALKPYEFMVVNTDVTTYPVSKPTNFAGESVSGGSVRYFPNARNAALISVKKLWKAQDGTNIEKTSGSVDVKLGRYALDEATWNQLSGNAGGGVTVPVGIGQWWVSKSEHPVYYEEMAAQQTSIMRLTLHSTIFPSGATMPEIAVRDQYGGIIGQPYTPKIISEADGSKTFIYEIPVAAINLANNEFIGGKLNTNDTTTWSVQTESYIPETPLPDALKDAAFGETVSLTPATGWAYTWKDLPISGTSGGKTVYYKYFLEELNVPNQYDSTSSLAWDKANNDFAFTLTNQENGKPAEYLLPKTGGSGTANYTVLGSVMILATIIFAFYINSSTVSRNVTKEPK